MQNNLNGLKYKLIDKRILLQEVQLSYEPSSPDVGWLDGSVRVLNNPPNNHGCGASQFLGVHPS